MSRPFSRAGVGYRLAALVLDLRIYGFHTPSVQHPETREADFKESLLALTSTECTGNVFWNRSLAFFRPCDTAASKGSGNLAVVMRTMGQRM